MRILFAVAITCALLFTLTSCSTAPDSPLFQPSAEIAPYQQPTFRQYQQETQAWLKKNRVFITDNPTVEIAANSPFQLTPEQPSKKGIILVHGLSGSPFYFKDVAKKLQSQGFIVRSMLLPGHGSKPADLQLATLGDWEKAVKHQIELLKSEVDTLWLGGFSTGANLVTSIAIDDPSIAGLLLFSPGFKSSRQGLFLAPVASKIIDWIDIDETRGNYTKYESLPLKGAATYYLSAQDALKKLSKKKYNKPVLITISEDDIVIDPQTIYRLFNQHFTHPSSQLVWYGDKQNFSDKRVSYEEKRIAKDNISTFSHMNVLFSPENTFYGKNGSFRFCSDALNTQDYQQCRKGENLWFAEYGYTETNKVYARISWNPYFEKLSASMKQVTQTQ